MLRFYSNSIYLVSDPVSQNSSFPGASTGKYSQITCIRANSIKLALSHIFVKKLHEMRLSCISAKYLVKKLLKENKVLN